MDGSCGGDSMSTHLSDFNNTGGSNLSNKFNHTNNSSNNNNNNTRRSSTASQLHHQQQQQQRVQSPPSPTNKGIKSRLSLKCDTNVGGGNHNNNYSNNNNVHGGGSSSFSSSAGSGYQQLFGKSPGGGGDKFPHSPSRFPPSSPANNGSASGHSSPNKPAKHNDSTVTFPNITHYSP